MGYDINVVGVAFFVAKKDKHKALEAMQAAAAQQEREENHLMWNVTAKQIHRCESLREALGAFGWAVNMDDAGNYNSIWYEGEKMGEDFIFDAIAPYVKAGSYIEISGNGGENRFRYYFDGKACRIQDAVMDWEDRKE